MEDHGIWLSASVASRVMLGRPYPECGVEVVMAWVEQTGQASWRVRYRREGGTIGSGPGFSSRRSAEAYANDVESDQRRKVWIDPAGGRLTLRSWVYPLAEITALDVEKWVKESREAGYATATVASWVKLLSMILGDAVRQRLIAVNPVRQRCRRGRRSRAMVAERVWASPEQVLRIANQAGVLGGEVARLLVITAAWTGCRWGELAALHRDNLDLDAGRLVVDAEVGSLHESRGRRWLGPPKTPSSARTIVLPPFLVGCCAGIRKGIRSSSCSPTRVAPGCGARLRPAGASPGDRRRWR
jgi:integrase